MSIATMPVIRRSTGRLLQQLSCLSLRRPPPTHTRLAAVGPTCRQVTGSKLNMMEISRSFCSDVEGKRNTICPLCGNIFKGTRSLNIHLGRCGLGKMKKPAPLTTIESTSTTAPTKKANTRHSENVVHSELDVSSTVSATEKKDKLSALMENFCPDEAAYEMSMWNEKAGQTQLNKLIQGVVNQLAEEKRFGEAFVFMKGLIENDVSLTKVSVLLLQRYHKHIEKYGKDPHTRKDFDVFAITMQNNDNYRISQANYYEMLRIASLLGDSTLAQGCYDRFKIRKPLSCEMYDLTIDAYQKEAVVNMKYNKWNMVLKCFNECIRNGVQPNADSLKSVIRYAILSGNEEGLREQIRKNRTDENEVVCDIFEYELLLDKELIGKYLKAGDVAKALAVVFKSLFSDECKSFFEKELARCFIPRKEQLLQDFDTEEAVQDVNKLHKLKNSRVDVLICYLVMGLLQEDRLSDVVEFARELMERLVPITPSFLALVKLNNQVLEFHQYLELLRVADEVGNTGVVQVCCGELKSMNEHEDGDIYRLLMKSYLIEASSKEVYDRGADVLQCFNGSMDAGFEPDEQMVLDFIEYSVRCDSIKEAWTALKRLSEEKKNVYMRVLYDERVEWMKDK